jgi:rhodanese-related sulfurtransferase
LYTETAFRATTGAAPVLTDLPTAKHNRAVPVPRITKEELKQQLDGGHAPVLLDVRLKYPYEHSTVKLPGALRVTPAVKLDTASIPRGRTVVAYDSDPDELVSSRVAAELIRQGYQASALKGGIAEWLTASFPTETKDALRSAPPEPGSLK